MGNTEINRDKYDAAVLFFLKHCNNSFLGRTKLNKLMYYLDFVFYRDYGESVTGDAYISKDFGPVPENIESVLSDLVSQERIKVKILPYKGSSKAEFELFDEPEESVFTKNERKLLEKICKQFRLWNTKKIVTQTHLEAPWFFANPYSKVDYEYAHDIDII